MIEAPDIAKQGNGRVTPQDGPLPRKRGRPKGLPKTGGRKKGQRNWTHSEIRSALLDRSDAIETLADVCAGRQLRVSGPTGKPLWRFPTMGERLRALELILKKVVPDLQATQLTGPDNAPIIPDPPGPVDTRQLARSILTLLSDAAPVKFEKSDIS